MNKKNRPGYENFMREAKARPDMALVASGMVANQAKASEGTVDEMLMLLAPYYHGLPKWKKSKFNASLRNLKPYGKLCLSKFTFGKVAEMLKNADRQDMTFKREFSSHIIEGLRFFCDGVRKEYSPRDGGELITEINSNGDSEAVEVRHQTIDVNIALEMLSETRGRFTELRAQVRKLLTNVPEGKAEILKPSNIADPKEFKAITIALKAMLKEQNSPFTCNLIKKTGTFIFIRRIDNPNARKIKGAKA